jgi:hypothetical protein
LAEAKFRHRASIGAFSTGQRAKTALKSCSGWYLEGSMQVYEIRVLSSSSEASTIMEAMYASDFAAIRAARNIAGDNRHEVWRGLDCIYGKYREAPNEIR